MSRLKGIVTLPNLILCELNNGPMTLIDLQKKIVAQGFQPSSVETTIYTLKAKGLVEKIRPGTFRLVAETPTIKPISVKPKTIESMSRVELKESLIGKTIRKGHVAEDMELLHGCPLLEEKSTEDLCVFEDPEVKGKLYWIPTFVCQRIVAKFAQLQEKIK